MSVKIRLSLTGKSHQISYRIVAQDTRSKRDGKFLEILGHLNPYQKTDSIKIDKDRVKYYLSHGATFTPSAKYVFENGKLPPKPKKKKEQKPDQPTSEKAPEVKSEETKTEEETIEKSLQAEVQKEQPQDQIESKEEEIQPENNEKKD
jgi:small subunit ribosomal protein S16